MLQIVFKALNFFLIFETVRPCCASGLYIYIYIGAYLSMYTMTYLAGNATQGTQRLKIRCNFFEKSFFNLSIPIWDPPIREPTLTNKFTSSSVLKFSSIFFCLSFSFSNHEKKSAGSEQLGVRHGEYHSIIFSIRNHNLTSNIMYFQTLKWATKDLHLSNYKFSDLVTVGLRKKCDFHKNNITF